MGSPRRVHQITCTDCNPRCQTSIAMHSPSNRFRYLHKRSSLFKEVKRIHRLVKANFPWAMCHLLMESVQSMDEADREVMSEDIELQPGFAKEKLRSFRSSAELSPKVLHMPPDHFTMLRCICCAMLTLFLKPMGKTKEHR